jgi:hypothetical protein
MFHFRSPFKKQVPVTKDAKYYMSKYTPLERGQKLAYIKMNEDPVKVQAILDSKPIIRNHDVLLYAVKRNDYKMAEHILKLAGRNAATLINIGIGDWAVREAVKQANFKMLKLLIAYGACLGLHTESMDSNIPLYEFAPDRKIRGEFYMQLRHLVEKHTSKWCDYCGVKWRYVQWRGD